jgi:transglutaminase-like putative cysteine protease
MNPLRLASHHLFRNRPIVVQLAATMLLCSLPGLMIGRVVQGYATIWVGVLAAIVGVLCGWAVTRIRNTRMLRVLIIRTLAIFGVAAILTIVIAAVKPGFRKFGLLRSCLDALLHGWADLATSPLPAFVEPRTLVPVALVAYMAGAIAALCAMAQRGPLMVLLTPTCAFLLAALAAGKHPFAAVIAGVSAVVLAGVILMNGPRQISFGLPQQSLARRNRGTRSNRHNRLVTYVTLAGLGALTLGVAIGIGPVLTFGRDRDPFDPRDHVRPPLLPSSAISPLELVAARRQAGNQPLFSVRSSKVLYPQDLRLVALNHFDGATWSTTAAYKRGGAVLDSVTRQTIATSFVEAQVTISDLDGPWLPSIGDPQRAVGVPVIIDPTSGSLVASDGVKRGVVYELTSLRPEPQVEQLVLLPVGSSQEALDCLVVPAGMPPLLTEMARAAIGDTQLPFQRAVELRNYLRASFTLNNAAPGGFSYGHLERAFGKRGVANDEQFAAMFATLGRVVGLPTRIVVGFTPPPADNRGVIFVRGADARVWAEVLFEGVGWMPFTATPSDDGKASSSIGFGGQPVVELREAPASEQTPVSPPVQVAGPAIANSPNSSQINVRSVLIVVLLSLLLVGIGFGGVVLMKRRQTARRRAATPRQSVIGAWQDVLDRLAEAGIRGTSLMTVEEVVQCAEESSAALTGLYRPINRALYSDAEITETEREQAWRARDRFVSGVNRRSSWRQRVSHMVDPRPLLASTPHSIGARP